MLGLSRLRVIVERVERVSRVSAFDQWRSSLLIGWLAPLLVSHTPLTCAGYHNTAQLHIVMPFDQTTAHYS